MKTKQLIFWIIYTVLLSIFGLLIIFYLDLANGPMPLLILELSLISIYFCLRIIFRHSSLKRKLLLLLGFVSSSLIICISSRPERGYINAYNYNNPTKTKILEVEGGKIQGVYNKNKTVEIYAGIPYARPPINELRWKEPQDVIPWDNVKDCSKFENRSYQKIDNEVMSSIVDIYAQKSWHPDYSTKTIQNVSEDSLYLNIWKPNTEDKNLPVLMFIHGGSLTSGSSAFLDYNGEEMAKHGVIMVTIQYRLGIFGYLAHNDLINESDNKTTGNYGLLDQIKALKWINDNIDRFGGDKNNITIAGESAGSSSVSALCVSPLAKGLFKRAIGESSSLIIKKPPHTYRDINKALKMGDDILKEFKCNSIDELRKVKASKLVNTKYTNSEMIKDGYAIPKDPYEIYLDGNNNEEALLNGYNVLEADAFIIPRYLTNPTNKKNIKDRLNEVFDINTTNKIMELYKDKIEKDAFSAFNEILSVWWFIYPHESWSKMAYDNGVKVYKYQFTKDNSYYGTYHSGEMIYAYGNVKNTKYKYRYNKSDLKLSDTMFNYWLNFIKTGNPNNSLNPEWSIWNKDSNNIIELGEDVKMIKDRYIDLYNIFNEMLNV